MIRDARGREVKRPLVRDTDQVAPLWRAAEDAMAQDLDTIWPPGPTGWTERYLAGLRLQEANASNTRMTATGQHVLRFEE